MTGRDYQLRMGQTLRAAVAGLRRCWNEAWGAILLGAVVWSARNMLPPGMLSAVWTVPAAIATLILVGALARVSISSDAASAKRLGLGPGGIQVRMAEGRLFGAFLLCAVFMAMILSVAALVLLAVFGMAGLDAEAIRLRDWAAVGPGWKLFLLALLTLLCLFAVIALAARLSMFAPATVGRGHMTSLTAISIVRGQFWPFLVGLIVTAAPTLCLLLFGLGRTGGAAGWAIWAIVISGLQAPLTLSYLGAVYRRLDNDNPQGRDHG